MRIDWIHLKSFLKHEDLRLEFSPDLNVMRSPNEGGKSSCIEGFGYFLSGSAALEKTIEATVNDQAKSKASMRVDCGFSHLGKKYEGYRAVSGAELHDADGKVLVTGQKELTKYLENLLNLPAGRAHHVVLARQNEIRGVLSLGPTAATEFIEKLADFSEIDDLIKRMVAELPSGKTDVLESSIVSTENVLESLVIPEVLDHSEALDVLKNTKEIAEQVITEINEKIAAQAAAAAEVARQRAGLEAKLATALNTASDCKRNIEGLEKLFKDEPEFKERAGEIELLLAEGARYKVYKAIQDLPEQGEIWEGGESTLDEEIVTVTAQLKEFDDNKAELKRVIESLEAKKIVGGACPTCGHVKGDSIKDAAHNAKLDAEIEANETVLSLSTSPQEEREDLLVTLQEIKKEQAAILEMARDWPESLFTWNIDGIPYLPRYTQSIPKNIDVEAITKELTQIQAKLNSLPQDGREALAVAKSKAEAANETLTELTAEMEALVIPEVYQAPKLLASTKEELTEAKTRIACLEKEMTDAQALADAVATDRIRWQKALTKHTTDLQETRENNVLIKAVRAARLKVSEQIWSTVMGGISGYFSQLRGQPSVVIRTQEGFLIDGKLGRPSGSTLDILGLALRIVVAKVFANSGLLVIDEPTANCDISRVGNVASVLGGSGFEQIIWVSHDDLSETFAAHLVEL